MAGENWRLGARVALLAVVFLFAWLQGCSTIFGSEPARYILYPARKGDTLTIISKRFDVSVDKLERVNRLKAGRALSVGQTIKVPYHGQSLKKEASDLAIGGAATQAKRPQAQESSLKKVKLTKAAKFVGKLSWPVGGSGGRFTSPFGRRWLSFHEGIDISAPEGTPVLSAHSGQVVYSGKGIQGYGNLVVVKGDGILSVYAHNSVNRARTGQKVYQGEKIAEVGMTGKSTGPHLHFETRIKDENGKNAAVDPLVFLKKQ